ncbi:MAG TPA: hypothetical protein VFY92_00105, partial [Hyphomicrobiaceae bacterium]|nr:hypothetical protein [Hyphomicrobiaceae bacterium]
MTRAAARPAGGALPTGRATVVSSGFRGHDPAMSRIVGGWLLVGWAGFLLLPWYAAAGGFWGFGWVSVWTAAEGAPAALQAALYGRWWLLPL